MVGLAFHFKVERVYFKQLEVYIYIYRFNSNLNRLNICLLVPVKLVSIE